MMILKIFFVGALLSFAVCAEAVVRKDSVQTFNISDRAKRSRVIIDSLLDYRDERMSHKIDTAFMQRASQGWRFKFTVKGSGSDILLKGRNAGGKYRSELDTDMKMTLSVGASYRGLAANLSFNPARLAGNKQDFELGAHAYANRMGVDASFRWAKTYNGEYLTDRGVIDIPMGTVRQNALTVNAYYIFNARRFSYPAALTQSWTQKRSCGSFMAGMSFMAGTIDVDRNDEIGVLDTRLRELCVSVGMGYGYNFVIGKKWLLHLSSLPGIVVYNGCKITTNGMVNKMPYRFPNFIVVGRVAAIRYFDRYFVGVTSLVNTSDIGDREQMSLINTKWHGRVFVGFNL